MIRMNMCHDIKNPPGQVRNEPESNTYKPTHGGYPELGYENARIQEVRKVSEDFYDQFIFNRFFNNWNSEYDR